MASIPKKPSAFNPAAPKPVAVAAKPLAAPAAIAPKPAAPAFVAPKPVVAAAPVPAKPAAPVLAAPKPMPAPASLPAAAPAKPAPAALVAPAPRTAAVAPKAPIPAAAKPVAAPAPKPAIGAAAFASVDATVEKILQQSGKAEASMLKITEETVAQGQHAMEKMALKAADAQETLRKATEQGVANGKAAYERVKNVAEEANSTLDTSFKSASKGFSAFNAKAFDAMRTNSEMMFDFIKALSGAKTMADVVALQTELARKQYEALTAQNMELAALAQKAATDAMEPLKAGFTKATKA